MTDLPTIFANFHFLRPLWLLALIPTFALAWLALRTMRQYHNNTNIAKNSQNPWTDYIDPHLLPYLLASHDCHQPPEKHDSNNEEHKRHQPFRLTNIAEYLKSLSVYLGLAFTIIAISAPTWQEKATPVATSTSPTMIVLSLAQSMNADDVQPTRLKRAIHKIKDILTATKGEQRGLVIYSDMAFTASPLTNDRQVIEQMLPELSTGLMPVLGNRLDIAIHEATDLLQRGGASAHTNGGNIIILTDGVGEQQQLALTAVKRARQLNYKVSILGIGTEQGTNLTITDGRKVSDRNGNIRQTKLDIQALSELAKAGGGTFQTITPSDQDIKALLKTDSNHLISGEFTYPDGDVINHAQPSNIKQWQDMGYWFLLIPLLFMPFAFLSTSSDGLQNKKNVEQT